MSLWSLPNRRDPRRTFSLTQKNEIWAQQAGLCARCRQPLDPRTAEYDRKRPWAASGQIITTNGRALCPNCHRLLTHYSRLQGIDISSLSSGYYDEVTPR